MLWSPKKEACTYISNQLATTDGERILFKRMNLKSEVFCCTVTRGENAASKIWRRSETTTQSGSWSVEINTMIRIYFRCTRYADFYERWEKCSGTYQKKKKRPKTWVVSQTKIIIIIIIIKVLPLSEKVKFLSLIRTENEPNAEVARTYRKNGCSVCEIVEKAKEICAITELYRKYVLYIAFTTTCGFRRPPCIRRSSIKSTSTLSCWSPSCCFAILTRLTTVRF